MKRHRRKRVRGAEALAGVLGAAVSGAASSTALSVLRSLPAARERPRPGLSREIAGAGGPRFPRNGKGALHLVGAGREILIS